MIAYCHRFPASFTWWDHCHEGTPSSAVKPLVTYSLDLAKICQGGCSTRGTGFEGPTPLPPSGRVPSRAETPTVASLGKRVRLVQVDPNRERQLADLVVSCEILRAEWERLFRQVVDLLNEGVQNGQGSGCSSPSDR
jgi:hypothetical protein